MISICTSLAVTRGITKHSKKQCNLTVGSVHELTLTIFGKLLKLALTQLADPIGTNALLLGATEHQLGQT